MSEETWLRVGEPQKLGSVRVSLREQARGYRGIARKGEMRFRVGSFAICESGAVLGFSLVKGTINLAEPIRNDDEISKSKQVSEVIEVLRHYREWPVVM